ncbi:MAG: hypothetical protein AAFR76_07050 [Planctomycetota bacterium]
MTMLNTVLSWIPVLLSGLLAFVVAFFTHRWLLDRERTNFREQAASRRYSVLLEVYEEVASHLVFAVHHGNSAKGETRHDWYQARMRLQLIAPQHVLDVYNAFAEAFEEWDDLRETSKGDPIPSLLGVEGVPGRVLSSATFAALDSAKEKTPDVYKKLQELIDSFREELAEAAVRDTVL